MCERRVLFQNLYMLLCLEITFEEVGFCVAVAGLTATRHRRIDEVPFFGWKSAAEFPPIA
jgi:hypothetical protein